MMKKYARLIAEIGIGANNKQDVNIVAPAEECAFVRYLVLELYACKCRSVSVDFSDSIVEKENLMHASLSSLKEVPEWDKARMQERVNKNVARIYLTGEDPFALRSVSSERIQKSSAAKTEAFAPIKKAYNNNEIAWCIAGVPTKAWAKRVFPDCSPTQAVLKLWQSIYESCYISEDNNPVEEWKKHVATLKKHAEILNEHNFQSLHYKTELGTDLTVGLARGHIWGAANAVQTRLNLPFIPNLPTEEVFTMPDRFHIDGIVYASRPLSHNGVIIDKFWLKFKDGKVVDFDAAQGKEELTSIIHYDENSCSLGEAALVPYDSPISKQQIIYQNTLFDENAACHLALGFSFNENLKGGESLTDDQVMALGGNRSKIHVDFMIGTKGTSIVGKTFDNQEVVVFKDGNFAF